jgi:cadmium resistance protein CadD (predicted permease)
MGFIMGILGLIGVIGGIKYLYDTHKAGNSIIPDNISSKATGKAKDIIPDIRWD